MACTAALTASRIALPQRKCSPAAARQRLVVSAAAPKRRGQRGPLGFVEEDNSGRSNIFAVEPRQLYTSSPTSDRAARQGLGGQQGLLLVGGVIAVVALVTVGQGLNPAETLEQAASAGAAGDSLSAIAARLASTL